MSWWRQTTRDIAAVQEGRAEVVEGASFGGGVRRSGGLTAMTIVTHVGAQRHSHLGYISSVVFELKTQAAAFAA
jgi:hypothetical protein